MASTVSERTQNVLERAKKEPAARIGAGAAAAAGAAIAAGALAKRIARSDGAPGGPSRAYRLKDGEEPGKGIRRIAYGRADDALEQLDHQPGGYAEAVHEARKDLKKLRSLLRLVRDAIGKRRYRAENARYRDAGRMLSSSRDAEVKLQTLNALRERFEDLDGATDRYASTLAAARAVASDDTSALPRVASEIEAGRAEISRWRLPSGSWTPAGRGLERAYGRGRKALRRVRGERSDEAVHEWRKRSKDLWYHLRILRPAWPAVMKPLAEEAHALSDRLGDHHDLAVLADDARRRASCFDDEAELEALLAAIRSRQDELLDTAIPLGARLYEEKPKAFRGRLESYLRAPATA